MNYDANPSSIIEEQENAMGLSFHRLPNQQAVRLRMLQPHSSGIFPHRKLFNIDAYGDIIEDIDYDARMITLDDNTNGTPHNHNYVVVSTGFMPPTPNPRESVTVEDKFKVIQRLNDLKELENGWAGLA